MKLEAIENHYQVRLPVLFRTLFENGMLDWMGGYGDPLPKEIDWVRDVYPKLHEHPPVLFHTGGDLLILSPKQIIEYTIPEEWDTDRYEIIPFARGSEENIFALFCERDSTEEPMVALLWEDDIDGEIIARNLEDFIFRAMVEAAEEFDREQTDSEYRGSDDPVEAYRSDILRDLETIRPYLKPEYLQALDDLYHGKVGTTQVSYFFQGSRSAEAIIETMLDFDRMNEELEMHR